MHKFNYNYKITNTKTGEFYIGVRSCDCEIELDSYMGSSSVWTKLYIKENKDFLKKEIVATFNTRKEANKGEVILLQKYKDNPLCINCYFDYTPDVTGTKQTPEWIEKRKMFGEKNGMFGKKNPIQIREPHAHIPRRYTAITGNTPSTAKRIRMKPHLPPEASTRSEMWRK